MKHDVYEDAASSTAKTRRGGGEAQPEKSGDADKQEMMRKAQEAGTPGPEHKHLEHFVGNWKCVVKCWMDPKGQPAENPATAKAGLIMNGRFLQEEFHGEMMGKAFQGRSVLGYNKLKKVFQYVWIDDMNTAMFQMEGKRDGKVITVEGPGTCPATGRTDIPMKIVLRVLGPDKHTFEMFDGSKGNARTMEITYTRQ